VRGAGRAGALARVRPFLVCLLLVFISHVAMAYSCMQAYPGIALACGKLTLASLFLRHYCHLLQVPLKVARAAVARLALAPHVLALFQVQGLLQGWIRVSRRRRAWLMHAASHPAHVAM
jgi:hypothetical protein